MKTGGPDDILVFGCSGHASVVIDAIEKQDIWKIAALVDDFARPGSSVMGYEVLRADTSLDRTVQKCGAGGGIVAIGDNFVRRKVVGRILSELPSFIFVTVIHPSAQIAKEACIGPGSVVMAGGVINSRTRIGSHCIVNTRASLDHDCDLADYASLGPNASLGGNVRVGELSFVGQSATVIHGRTVGANSVVGAGAVAIDDIPSGVVAYGVPARVRRVREAGEKYL